MSPPQSKLLRLCYLAGAYGRAVQWEECSTARSLAKVGLVTIADDDKPSERKAFITGAGRELLTKEVRRG